MASGRTRARAIFWGRGAGRLKLLWAQDRAPIADNVTTLLLTTLPGRPFVSVSVSRSVPIRYIAVMLRTRAQRSLCCHRSWSFLTVVSPRGSDRGVATCLAFGQVRVLLDVSHEGVRQD